MQFSRVPILRVIDFCLFFDFAGKTLSLIEIFNLQWWRYAEGNSTNT